MINKSELPQNWEIKKLGEVCKLKNGFAFKSTEYKNEGIPVIRISDIKDGFVTSKKAVRVTPNAEFDNYQIESNDIIVAMSGATTGKFGIYRSQEKAYQNQRVGKFKVLNEKLLQNEFLYYQIYSLKRQIEKDAYGGAQPNISSTKIEEMEIVLPPLAEQELIVAKIEELFSELDAGLESLKTAQAQLKTYCQSVLKYAFEGKLTNDSVSEGELPNGWKWKKLSDLTEKISDGPFGSNLKSVDYVDEGVRVIRLENIGVLEFKDEYKTFVTEEKYKTISRHTVTKGDIIFSSFIADQIRATILPDFIEKAINKADCFCVRTSENTIDKKFLVFFLATKALYNQLVNEVHGATRPRINTTQLKSSLIPVCSLKEQQRIVEEIESRLSVCDKLEETINASLKQAEALRQSILKQAFEGKLVKVKEIEKPKKTDFQKMQELGFIVNRSQQRNIRPGEMVLAKFAFLADRIHDVKIYDRYENWHLGPYPTEIKKHINNRKYFAFENGSIRVLNTEQLFKYSNPDKEKIENAIDQLADIFDSFDDPRVRSHKIELLATACKAVEDVRTTEIKAVRQLMAEWKINLKDKRFSNKAEKFSEDETAKCLKFVTEKGWDKKLIR
jgi:type I restriction enzyme, S subunit